MLKTNSKQFYNNLDRYVLENLQEIAEDYRMPKPQTPKEAYDLLWIVYKDQCLFSAGFGSFENFKGWAYVGLFDFCLGSAVDTLCDMLEITNEKRHKYTEQEAETVLLYMIFNRMVKNIGDAYFIKRNWGKRNDQ